MVLTMLILTTSCNKAEKVNEAKETLLQTEEANKISLQTEETVKLKKRQDGHSLYVMNDYGVLSPKSLINENAKVKIESYATRFAYDHADLEKDANAPNTYTFEIGTQKYEMDFLKTVRIEGTVYNHYMAEKTDLRINSETGEIGCFWTSADNFNSSNDDITEEEAKIIADKTFKDLYGLDAFNEYKLKHRSLDQESYHLEYKKYVHGIESEDRVIISVYLKGEISGVNAYQKGKLTGIEQIISKDDIDNTLVALSESVVEGWEISDIKEIVCDNEGYCYIRTFIRGIVDGETKSVRVYVSIQ